MSKIPFVNANCIGCWACVAISPDAFDLNEEWLSIVKDQDSYENMWVEDSIRACPVSAIVWKEVFLEKSVNNPDFNPSAQNVA